MPIYEKIRRGKPVYQVVVHLRGQRRDLIVRGSYDNAKRAELGLLAKLQNETPRREPRWRQVSKRAPEVRTDTFIYFIQAGDNGPIKIGRSDFAGARLETMQIGNHEELRLLCCFRDTHLLETRLHRRFSATRIRGEWFKPTPDLLRLIQALAKRAAR